MQCYTQETAVTSESLHSVVVPVSCLSAGWTATSTKLSTVVTCERKECHVVRSATGQIIIFFCLDWSIFQCLTCDFVTVTYIY